MNSPHELVEHLARGDGVLLVGAGLSQGAGLPGWNDLLNPLADRIGLPSHLRTDPLKVAQYYENQRGRHALIQHIMEQTDTTGKGPTDNHRRLLRLGAGTWVTTNYDDLIERTFQEADIRFNNVVRDQDLPYVSSDRVTLVKMHGDGEQKDTIVITQRDYQTYFRRFPRIKDKLAGLLLEKTFLFVGYSVNDPDFNQIQAEIAYDLQQHQRMAYAVLFDADEFTVADLCSRNIHVLNIPLEGHTNYSQRLGGLLDNLIRQVEQARQPRTRTAPSTVVTPTPTPIDDVRGLLEAMGYRITDTKSIDSDLYFLCDAKWGAEIRPEVVHFVGDQPTANNIAALNDAVISCDAARGILLTHQPLPDSLCSFARQRERIQCYTLDEFTNCLADFRPYLERLIQEYEASEIPALYVPLAAESETGEDREPQVFKPLESFVDAWLTKSGRNHLSILGDFGSGKTWFCQRYAYLAARRYLADPVRNRIPILITLRDYSRAYDVEQLITDAIVNRYKVGLAAGYKTFARINESGRLLLIFDGFDEMERRVSDYRTTVENFWELAKVTSAASKVLLTCRTAYFRHRSEEEETLTSRRRGVSVVAGEHLIDLRDQERFEVAHLQEFDDDDIRLALEKRLPTRWDSVHQKIHEFSNLRDLASRPLLLDMIVRTMPEIQNADQINQTTLYETYVDALLKRRWSEDTDYISPEDRLFFMQELAWEMYTSQRLTIPFSEFPRRVAMHFGLKDDPELAAFFERDVRTQSYLIRDDAGNYRFAHKSFLEFFVAHKMVQVVCGQDSDEAEFAEVWSSQPLSQEVLSFLVHMVHDQTLLWTVIERTRGKTFQEVGYSGGNAITVLSAKGESFAGCNLEGTVLADADFHVTDLTGANLRGTYLVGAFLSDACLVDADLSGANLSESSFQMNHGVMGLAFSADSCQIASSDNTGRIRIWNAMSGEEVQRMRWRGAAWSVSFSPDGCNLVAGTDGNILTIWHLQTGALLHALSTNGHELMYSPNGKWIACAGHGVALLDAKDLHEVARSETHELIRALAWRADSRHIITGSWSKRAAVWELGETLTPLIEFQAHDDVVDAVAFHPHGQLFATGSRDGSLKVWRASPCRLLFSKKFGAAKQASTHVHSLEYSPDGMTLVAALLDGTVIVYGTDDEEVSRFKIRDGLIWELHFSRNGDHLAIGTSSGHIHLFDGRSMQHIRTMESSPKLYGLKIPDVQGLDQTVGLLKYWGARFE